MIFIFISFIALMLGACGNDNNGTGAVSGTTFIALESTFADFKTWQHFDLGDMPAMGAVHPAGDVVDYISAMPPAGSNSFPVGSIIVKTIGDPPTVHAMVKRGGDFNSAGAKGWEWFELTLDSSDVPHVKWRGDKPPSGEGYTAAPGDTTGGDCNTCHGAAVKNDYVQSGPLQLK